jgi:hypothetical protein
MYMCVYVCIYLQHQLPAVTKRGLPHDFGPAHTLPGAPRAQLALARQDEAALPTGIVLPLCVCVCVCMFCK